MATEYSIETCQQLQKAFGALGLHRPLRVGHYDAGTELEYTITPVEPGPGAVIRLSIEKFVGGGFAGQVYKVKLTAITMGGQPTQTMMNLHVGGTYAVKILIPPSSGSLLFRNFLYAVGFQGPFQLQVNPVAARAGALWQKFIRAAAQIRFNDPQCVNDIHATFVDSTLGSCGEISDWVEGRTWRLEVDDHLDALKRWKRGKPVDENTLGSPEYRTKYRFMTAFVDLLHELGAHEFARQYEWTTCKSQPNALKRLETNHDPAAGLIGVDFRAGLALLVCLPMSPGDFKLIWQGLKRGSLVQFDRGDLTKLEQYINEHPQILDALPAGRQMLEELKTCEIIYRDSVPDITHNHIRLLYDGRLWKQQFDSAVTGWQTRNLIDVDKIDGFRQSKFKTLLFFLLGLIPILGRVGRKVWARTDWRKHYGSILASVGYFKRAFKGRMLEKLIKWHENGRMDNDKAMRLQHSVAGYLFHVPFSILPAGLHRFLTDPQILKDKLYFLFVRPYKLLRHAELREQWMRDMIIQSQKKHILSDEDAAIILSQLDDPYIQKYLIALVLHLLTIPVTQLVGVIIAVVHWIRHPELTWVEASAYAVAVQGILAVVPISPGSFSRGLITTIMAIRDQTVKDYNIALFLSFFKYIGYLAFPIQMTYRYPAMARFMAAHWATDAVHIVPVFGERGALFEHWIFCAFYNWPLTIRRRMQQISKLRANLPTRIWHIPVITMVFAGILAGAYHLYYTQTGTVPSNDNKWFMSIKPFFEISVKPFLAILVVLLMMAGGILTRLAGGLSRMKRILAAMICGIFIGIGFSVVAFYLEKSWQLEQIRLLVPMVWRSFAGAIFCTIGAVITEIKLPEPTRKSC
ncbi:MAG: hypothetical protein ISS71_03295 [Phycisphaerae bacterium]|nr:hypothetical protein [Phycisphaerae bacterium]